MERGKIKLKGDWLGWFHRYLQEGWKPCGITKKDADGYYWVILERNRQQVLI